MCGIVGFCSKGPIDREELSRAVGCTNHRGPDGQGIKLFSDNLAGLGHNRLAIIDLSASGAQPMSNEDGSIWMTFNGEIYNYRHLRNLLLEAGHQFRSNSDTEVLVHGYEEWGCNLFERVEGMFALGIWDGSRRQMVLARDRMGIKPLNYYWDGQSLIFGSELKSFYPFAAFKREVDISAVIDYLHYYVVPAPKTIWKNTFKLLPGHYLTYTSDASQPVITKYWSIPAQSQRVPAGLAVENVGELLEKSVRGHLESDVPVGVFLSSGYDSSALVSYSSEIVPSLDTFSIGFKDSIKTEHREAANIARHFDTNHNEMILEEDYMDVLPELAGYYDEPFGVTSMVSYYYVSRLARRTNKVVLAGDGGDEVFGGYNWYRKISKQFNDRSIIQRLRHLNGDRLKAFYQSSYFSFMGTNVRWVSDIISDEIREFYPDDVYWPYALPDEQWKLSPIKVFQLLDFKRFLPDVALPRADRSSMATSLEVRVPFLDHNLVEYLMKLDEKVYFRENVKKYLLHENIKTKLPQEILALPKKGFGNPLDPFFSQKERIISRIRDGKLLKSGLFNEKLRLETLDKKQLWLLYNLELWMAKWQ